MSLGPQNPRAGALLASGLAAAMLLVLVVGAVLMTRDPHHQVAQAAPAAQETAHAAAPSPSAEPVAVIHKKHSGPAVTQAFPHTTEMPPPRHTARAATPSRKRTATAPAARPAPAPAPTRVPHHRHHWWSQPTCWPSWPGDQGGDNQYGDWGHGDHCHRQ